MSLIRIFLIAIFSLGSATASGDPLNLMVTEAAPGIYIAAGAQEDASAANHGAIANIGFIVGKRCVAVIDSGGSRAIGEALRRSISEKTALPICYVINTHMHPDHVFGNAAFTADHPAYVGHVKLAAGLRARRDSYLHVLQRELGAEAKGSDIISPTLTVDTMTILDLGDRSIRLHAWPTAHTDNDLTVFDEQTGTLWAGDLLFVERLPVVDGSVVGWLKVLEELQKIDMKRVVPGHGSWTRLPAEAFAEEKKYLAALRSEVATAIKQHMTLQQAVKSVSYDEKQKWKLFDAYHPRNVTAVYTELEWE